MVDKEIIKRKLSRLRDYINELKDSKDITWEKYTGNKRDKAFIERYIHLAIEEIFDISNHIISYHGFREPENYRDTFTILAEKKIILKKDLKNFQEMASFRNILVHHYDKIDDEVVYGIFKKKLSDFEKFEDNIMLFMQSL